MKSGKLFNYLKQKDGRLTVIIFLFLTFFLSGCTIKNSITNKTPIELTEPKYQYSAPWDKTLYDGFYSQIKNLNFNEDVKGGIVPHHLLAGFMPATFFNSLQKQNPSVIVLIGPNHFNRGKTDIITSERSWKTIYGITKSDNTLISKLSELENLSIDEKTIAEEHSIYSLIPFITKSLPKTNVLPIILKNNVEETDMLNLINKLIEILPNDAVIVSSIDFSHYQTLPVANFHDELSMGVIKNFEYSRLKNLEIDSVPSLYVLMKLMQNYTTQKVIHEEHANSALLTNALDTEETTSYYSPYFTKGEPTQEKTASILFFGDMMLDRNVKKKIDENTPDYLFTKLAGEENRFFSGMDIITANLEGPFANYRRETTKEIAFWFDPILISTLKKYNFSLFTIANNHTLDMSKAGLEESKVNLKNADIDFYGDGYGIGDSAYITKNIGGIKFAFVGFNDTYFPLDINQIKDKIISAKKESDLVVVNIHWGAEYKVLNSNERQQYLAHFMIDNGADVIIGHHPHVIQEMEIYKDKPIFYSLGNFIFDQYFSPETQQGLAVGIIFKTNKLSLYILPLEGDKSAVRQVPYEQAKTIMQTIIDKSRLEDYYINNFNLKIN